MAKKKKSLSAQKMAEQGLDNLDKIFEWARKELGKAEELLLKRKADIILETAKKLEDAGVQENGITMDIIRNLKGYVDDSYVRKVLIDYPQYKDQYQSKRAKSGRKMPAQQSTNNSSSEDRAKQAQTEHVETMQAPQQTEEQEEASERAEIYWIKLSDARIEDIDLYDVPALRRLLGEALQRIAELEKEVSEKNG